MKFDICLMNPPYATTGGGTNINVLFVDKILDIAHKQITVMPFRFVTNIENRQNKKFKPKFDKYLISVEQIKNPFSKVDVNDNSGIGIYYFSDSKSEDNINIKYLDKEENLKSLSEVSSYTPYEKEIIYWLSKNGNQRIIGSVAEVLGWKKKIDFININNSDIVNQKYKELINKKIGCKNLKKVLDENPGCCGLIVSRANGTMNAKCFTSKNGQIYDKYEDFENLFIKNKPDTGYNVLMFKSKEAAENAKVALQNPVLRFTFLREQKEKWMKIFVYQYVPHIDWEDERCRTDVGLLELCGCPKDKAIEYSNYCKKIIDKLDRK